MKEKSRPDRFSVTVEDVRSFVQPSAQLMKRVLSLQRAWHRPVFFGIENVDAARPALFVGNHTIYGVLDMPLFINGLHQQGILVRGLADRGHFMVPGYRELLSRLGAVVGTRENCSALMTGGAHVLVYPGGAREVFKRKGEAYRLIWKERLGFVRMAVEHGYPIVPFGAVGAEECFDVMYDGEELMRSPLGLMLKATGLADKFMRNGEAVVPVGRGLGLSMIPKPERFYFGLAAPIETRHLKGRHNDEATLRALRDQVREAVETQIAAMKAYRQDDPKRGIVSGWLHERINQRKPGGGATPPAPQRAAAGATKARKPVARRKAVAKA